MWNLNHNYRSGTNKLLKISLNNFSPFDALVQHSLVCAIQLQNLRRKLEPLEKEMHSLLRDLKQWNKNVSRLSEDIEKVKGLIKGKTCVW